LVTAPEGYVSGMTDAAASVVVVEPSPLLTITIERAADEDEVHLHAGGQGSWIARMLAALAVRHVVCCPFGGETGAAIELLAPRVELRPVGSPSGPTATATPEELGAKARPAS
jgi:1-phosphofructokinase